MKKGFTLIEMLGIMAVLAIVLLVTFPVLNKSLKKMKENTKDNFTNNLKISAETYIELNRDNYPELDEIGSTTITINDLYDAELLKGNYEVDKSNQIIITKKQDGTLEYYYINLSDIKEYNFTYTGAEQEFITPQDGLYKIETWGAQGGKQGGILVKKGYGGYSIGDMYITKNTSIYVNVGGQGNQECIGDPAGYCPGGYNGGGDSCYRNNEKFGAGGGATHIALKSGLLSSLSSAEDISKILIVSGGGGGTYAFDAGSAGGYIGNDGYLRSGYIESTGGTQISGGTGETGGAFGQGGSKSTGTNGTGGGAGFYGAGSSLASSAGGGSSYIGNPLLTGKYMYCYDCQESTDASTLTVSTTGTSPLKDTTNCPDGYNENAISKCAKSGNGYARITYLGNKI